LWCGAGSNRRHKDFQSFSAFGGYRTIKPLYLIFLLVEKKAPDESEASCGVGRDRTADTRIFSPLLYRLSYRTKFVAPFIFTPFPPSADTAPFADGKNKVFGLKVKSF
jgi:hypothetical protein